jgi:hypothetical protein
MGLMRLRGLLLVLVGVVVLGLPAGASALSVYQPAFSFAGGETPAGSFGDANGVAVDEATGDVYVADVANNVVDKFTAAGVYLGQITGVGSPAGGFAFANPAAVAVDNSTNPLDASRGDVYVLDSGHNVIDRFDDTGLYLGQLKETGGGPFAGTPLYGVAVDSEGNAWVYQSNDEVDEFDSSGGFVSSFSTGFGASPGFAVDALDDVFFLRGFPATQEETSTGGEPREVDPCGCGVAIATNRAGDVYVDEGADIAEFDAAHHPLTQFGSSQLTASGTGGIAVSSATGRAYVANPADGKVYAYDAVVVPDTTTEPASSVRETSATLNGTVNPAGLPVTSCSFEYGTEASYGQSVPCAQTPAQIGSGTAPVAVSANLSGLQPLTTYHFRFVAGNANGVNEGARDETFITPTQPSVEGVSLAAVGSTTATVGTQVNANYASTSYYVEYGTSAAYGSSIPAESLGVPLGPVGVQIHMSGLQPGTVYHYRVVALNTIGITRSADATFTTLPSSGASGTALPDGRAFEQVSPPGNGEVYIPDIITPRTLGFEDSRTDAPYRAAADGDGVVYVGDPPGSGVGGNGQQGNGHVSDNEYLATRSAQGWTAGDIEPPPPVEGESHPHFQALSNDLSMAYFNSSDQPPLAGAPANCDGLYSRSGEGVFARVFTSTLTPGYCGRPLFAGASVDGSRVFFQSEAALIAGAVPASGSVQGQYCFYDCDLYESVGGRLSLVNVLPGGGVDPHATFGGLNALAAGLSEEFVRPDLSGAVSADGLLVFWSDASTGVVYVRVNGTSTVQVSAGAARFWGASADGRFAFYTEGERLLRFDLEKGTREELAGAGADVQGVTGISEDGSYVYFVANGALAAGATPGTCQQKAFYIEEEGLSCSLYALHVGEPAVFVASLAATDNNISVNADTNENFGDWAAPLGLRTAEVSADGHAVAFSSSLPLAGTGSQGGPNVFVYTYGRGGGHMLCASCDRFGVGGEVIPSLQETFMRRWFSDDGNRVFFETAAPLSPADLNGRDDVYEWERDGSGSCGEPAGCVYLLSGGTSGDESIFVDASANGDDVFFTSRGQLVPSDHDESIDLYDARVGGGFASVSAPMCSGADCQGVPPAPSVFATPSSATFSGGGNLAPPPVVGVKAKAKKVKQCRRGSVRRHGRCVKQKPRARAKGSGKRAKKGRK